MCIQSRNEVYSFVPYSSENVPIVIHLRERHLGHSGALVVSWELHSSSLHSRIGARFYGSVLHARTEPKYSDDSLELRFGRWTLRLRVNVNKTGLLKTEDAPGTVLDTASSPLPSSSNVNVREEVSTGSSETHSTPSALTSDANMGFAHREAATNADRGESRPFDTGTDVAKAKSDANEAFTSLANITPGPRAPQPFMNDAVLSSIVSQSGSWTLLSNRLTTLLGVADQVAEVCRVSLDTSTSEQSANHIHPMP